MVVKVIQGHSRCVWGRVHTFIFAAKHTMIVQISFWKRNTFYENCMYIWKLIPILDVHFIICMVWHVDWCLIWILDVAITKIFRIFFLEMLCNCDTWNFFSNFYFCLSDLVILWMTTTNIEISAKIFFDVQSFIFLALWKY